MTFNMLLKELVQRGASDIHLHAGLYPMARVNGKLVRVGNDELKPEVTAGIVNIVCDERTKEIFDEKKQVDLSYSIVGVGRFRVNLFRQRGSISAVLRIISSDEEQLKVVSLPQATIEHIRDLEKGIVLVTGPTGSGKSTTLARIIDEINRKHNKMIVTVEDPIEYMHQPKESIIVQREIGMDAVSFSEALRAGMRQDPDIIMIGEIRDYATAVAAISAAQTGHLVFSTLHTLDTIRTINRVIELFPPHERTTARILFADSMQAIIAQRLLPLNDGKGRACAHEILLGTIRAKDLIRNEERSSELYDAIKDGRQGGMTLFDDSLLELYRQRRINFETAYTNANNANDFKIRAKQVDADLEYQQLQATA